PSVNAKMLVDEPVLAHALPGVADTNHFDRMPIQHEFKDSPVFWHLPPALRGMWMNLFSND
ncbi:MAG: hypothetical protein KDK40_04480, partial [Chlamydiia bacterium]|nr:hypothetical protein [Chlamydiia bacterium]